MELRRGSRTNDRGGVAGVAVALDIYDRRDFTALPVLADLLEEAGCPKQSKLDHCRDKDETRPRLLGG
jgi:hypothetical protein